MAEQVHRAAVLDLLPEPINFTSRLFGGSLHGIPGIFLKSDLYQACILDMSTEKGLWDAGNESPERYQDYHSTISAMAHSTPLLKYGHKQEEGAIRQRWLTDSTDPDCPIYPTSLTIQDLIADGWDYIRVRTTQPEELSPDPISASLPQSPRSHRKQRVKKLSNTGDEDKVNKHCNIICEGAIIGKNIRRYDGPYWSQIAQAMYQEYLPMETLGHVYFTNIGNTDTLNAVRDQLYRANGFSWPPVGYAGFRTWRFGEPGYQCILGTRLGKAVVYLLLGAFPRGSWFIERVVTWGWDLDLQMRFDVARVQH